MSTDHVQTAPEAAEPVVAPEPYSAEWWQGLSAAELREIIKHGFRLGQTYDSAIAETERRAREALRRVRDEKSAAEQRNAKTRLAVLVAVLVGLLAMGFLDWLAF